MSNMIVFASSYYFVIFGYCLLEAYSFPIRHREGGDPEGGGSGEELGEVEKRELKSGYIIWENNPFSIKGKNSF